ncbi:MAG: hypothetical protein FJ006_10795 [Chloroflexi bacterium]|nr:hypothetical protein [Chloroflexota bacterium]
MKKLSLVFPFCIIACLVFSVSCVSKEVPVIETYYQTEYRTEKYTELTDVVVDRKEGMTIPQPTVKWWSHLYGDRYVVDTTTGSSVRVFPTISYYGYDMSKHQHSENHIEIRYSYSGMRVGFPFSWHLRAFDLTDVGQIFLPTDFELGQSGQYEKTKSIHGAFDLYEYKPTQQETAWLGTFHSAVGEPDDSAVAQVSWTIPAILLSSAFTKSDGNELTTLGRAIFGVPVKENRSITLDAQGIREFAIIAQTLSSAGVFSSAIELQSVHLVWSDVVSEKRPVTKERQVPVQVEKQRTVMQTKKVPFWEAVSGK